MVVFKCEGIFCELENGRARDQLLEEDGDADCKERHRPCDLTNIQHDAAFHRFLHDFHCRGYQSTVLSGKVSKMSGFVSFADIADPCAPKGDRSVERASELS
jgi:hypothetical protein